MLQGSRYASETSYYKKLKNEQLQDNVSNNEKLVKHFLVGHFSGGEGGGGQFFWGSIFLSEGCNFSRGNFPEGQCFLGQFSEGFLPREHFSGYHFKNIFSSARNWKQLSEHKRAWFFLNSQFARVKITISLILWTHVVNLMIWLF